MNDSKSAAHAKSRKVIPLQMNAAFFFERAVQSLDRYHYDKALKYFRKAVEYEPDNPVNHCNMAGVLSELGNYEASNEILQKVVDEIDPNMTECYFYMANNYANMENYEAAESALVTYLETDVEGHYLEESEEMMELLSYELARPTKLKNIKSKENLFAHDRARKLLEEGNFGEARRILEALIARCPDFLAARNNLALACFYQGNPGKALEIVEEVLAQDPGNLHALCNKGIFLSHLGDTENLPALQAKLRVIDPLHHEHVFKLATTLGILGEHAAAYRHFRRLLKAEDTEFDAYLFHYAAVAAYNTGRFSEAAHLWKQAERLDPESQVPKFYLHHMQSLRENSEHAVLSYYYHLPYEEQIRTLEKTPAKIMEQIRKDTLVRASYFWALRHGDDNTKLQVLQVLALLQDAEVEEALRKFVMLPHENDDLKKIALFVLRSMGVRETIKAHIYGKTADFPPRPHSPALPVWEEEWQRVIDEALNRMGHRYDIVQKHDLQTLWVEFLSRTYPDVPRLIKPEGWAAALEYLTAKMHRRKQTLNDVAVKYGVSVATVRRRAQMIDDVCRLNEKMKSIYSQFT
ncbi:MAG TPA: tetratricopeptide repeat protein [Bacilli bacterium]